MAPLGPSAVGRSRLLRAEWQALAGALDQAQAELDALRPGEGEAVDPVLQSDRCWLAQFVALSRGDAAAARALTAQALQWAEQAQDASRIDLCLALLAFDAVKADVQTAEREWRARLQRMLASSDGAVAAFAQYQLGMMAYYLGQPDQAALAFVKALDELTRFGMAVTATLCANNASAAFDDLQDLDAALDWAQRGLDTARVTRLPMPLGLALWRVAERLRLLGRFDEAAACLDESRQLLQSFRDSRNFVLVLIESGELAVVLSQPTEAQRHFEEARDRATWLGASDLLASAWQGLARVALSQGLLDRAEQASQQVLQVAQHLARPMREAEARMTLGRCKAMQGALDDALALMRSAVETAGKDHPAPASWWGELAECWAAVGDYAQAYEARGKGDAALRVERNEQAQARALGLQVRLQTARLQSQAEAARQRADWLEASTRTLMQLGEVGQELTSLLVESEVYEAIYRHVEALLAAEHFAVYLLERDGRQLQRVFSAQGKLRFEPAWVAVDDPHAHSALCVRERRELVLDLDPHNPLARWIPGAQHCQSALFAPLRSGDRALGVMSIQALQAQAFGDRELQVFRSLCAYASIAIANAQAYRMLGETQRNLARQQRLASVGGMVAGVAHEMNTPIGNAMLAASTLEQSAATMAQALARGAVTRGHLSRFVQEVSDGGGMVLRNLERAAALVQAFKQVVQDRRTLTCAAFPLRQEVELLLAGLARKAQADGHRLDIDIPDALVVEGYREAFGDLLGHWADNAMAHGLCPERAGRLCVQAQLRDDTVHLHLSDDGGGMEPATAERAFEPFFTTRLGSAHSGLGLAVVHSIAVDLFGGELHLKSQPGEGTTLVWTFPRVLTPSSV
jgi:signal transduction histidine kinase